MRWTWTAWAPAAVVGDKVKGVFANPDRVHKIKHAGKHFNVEAFQIYPSTAEGLAAVQYYPYDTCMKNGDDLVKVWDQEILREAKA